MDLSRTHLDRVSDYAGTLPHMSAMPDPTRDAMDGYDISLALALAANLHDRDLITAMTRTRTVTDSADDLDRIADHKGMDADTARSMRHVADGLRAYDAAEVAR